MIQYGHYNLTKALEMGNLPEKQKINEQQLIGSMLNLREDQLRRISDPELRKPFEEGMRSAVRLAVHEARSTNLVDAYTSATLILHSMRSEGWRDGFALWDARRGILLGTEDCKVISMAVLAEEGFTEAEAQGIIAINEEAYQQ